MYENFCYYVRFNSYRQDSDALGGYEDIVEYTAPDQAWDSTQMYDYESGDGYDYNVGYTSYNVDPAAEAIVSARSAWESSQDWGGEGTNSHKLYSVILIWGYSYWFSCRLETLRCSRSVQYSERYESSGLWEQHVGTVWCLEPKLLHVGVDPN